MGELLELQSSETRIRLAEGIHPVEFLETAVRLFLLTDRYHYLRGLRSLKYHF